VFGYDFSPAGGGLRSSAQVLPANPLISNNVIRFFETQQISFYTGTDFFPFIHHVNTEIALTPRLYTNNLPPVDNEILTYQEFTSIDTTPISRQVYITSDKDITISVGLVLQTDVAVTGAIPITNRTPALLTYGGSPQTPAVQTDLGPALTPIQFMQPSIKDFQDFGFGLLPNGANGQVFATPDATNGLLDPGEYLNTIGGGTLRDAAACNYFLCLHYALYTRTIPEQRG
jgi:hypothetical protein